MDCLELLRISSYEQHRSAEEEDRGPTMTLSTTLGTIISPFVGRLFAMIEESSARRVGGFQLGRVKDCGHPSSYLETLIQHQNAL